MPKRLTIWEKFLLSFERKQYSERKKDYSVTKLTYKMLNGAIYILKLEKVPVIPRSINCRCVFIPTLGENK